MWSIYSEIEFASIQDKLTFTKKALKTAQIELAEMDDKYEALKEAHEMLKVQYMILRGGKLND